MTWPVRKTAAIYRSKTYQRQRRAFVKAFRPGQPCVICGHPIRTVRYASAQHEPHTERVIGLAHGVGNECATCGRCNQNDADQRNPRAGQRNSRPNPLAAQRNPPPRRWIV